MQENAFENVVWEMAAILSQPQCVKCNLDIEMLVHYGLVALSSYFCMEYGKVDKISVTMLK